MSSFEQSIQSSYYILSNEESTRRFVSVTLHDHPIQQPLLNLIKGIDNVLIRFQKEPYYVDPKFHISILSMTSLPDLDPAVTGDIEAERTSNTSIERLIHIVPSNYASTLSSSSSSLSQYPTFTTPASSTSTAANASNDESDDNSDDDEDVFVPLSQQKKLAMLPLSTVLSISCIECRIGDRLFRLQLPKTLPTLPITGSGAGTVGGGEEKVTFTEIFD